jgi:synaptotagmin-like protein
LREDINSSTLWVSVWDWDKYGRNQFLGEVRLPLSQQDLTIAKDRWHPLQEKVRDTLLHMYSSYRLL